MILQALLKLGLSVRPPKEAERPGSDGQRSTPRGPSGDKAKRERSGADRSPHPVLNAHGETTGKLIDTEA